MLYNTNKSVTVTKTEKEMNNEPVAWMLNGILHECDPSDWAKEQYPDQDVIPLYTHTVKKLTNEEIEECCCFLDVRLHHRYEPNAFVKDIEWTVSGIKDFVLAILRKAQEK